MPPRLALEHGLDRAVRAVRRPAGDAARSASPAHRVAEEDPLHPPVGAHPPADGHAGYGRTMASIEALDTDITHARGRRDRQRGQHASSRTAAGSPAAIARAGGPASSAESDDKAPIGLGEAVETTGGEMPCRWVIHAATMELGGPTSAEIIRRATAARSRGPTSSAPAASRWSPSAPASAASRSTRPRGSRSRRSAATSGPDRGSSGSSSPSTATPARAAFQAAIDAVPA